MELKKDKPTWLKMNKEQAEALIIKLHEQGLKPEKIGLVLRDTYGLPSAREIAGKISTILKKHGKKDANPSDLSNLISKSEKLRKHFGTNKQDKVAKRGLQITEAKVKKLREYYERKS